MKPRGHSNRGTGFQGKRTAGAKDTGGRGAQRSGADPETRHVVDLGGDPKTHRLESKEKERKPGRVTSLRGFASCFTLWTPGAQACSEP